MRDNEYPALYRSASDLSAEAQQAFFRAFVGHMFFLGVATVISFINSPTVLSAGMQAMSLLAALACAIYLFTVRPERRWYAGRAVAESVKTVTWRFVMRAEPYDHNDSQDRSDFNARLKVIVEQNKEVAKLFTTNLSGDNITESMSLLRSKSTAERQEYYIDYRVNDQLTWYAAKAKHNKRMVKLCFIALLLTIAVAIGFAIARVAYPDAQQWPTDVFVVLAASILSWVQAKRYQELSASYALTAHEIRFVKGKASVAMSNEDMSKFIGDAENAFSREHTQWIARADA